MVITVGRLHNCGCSVVLTFLQSLQFLLHGLIELVHTSHLAQNSPCFGTVCRVIIEGVYNKLVSTFYVQFRKSPSRDDLCSCLKR